MADPIDWSDGNLANWHIGLSEDPAGKMTNEVTLMVRADKLHADESGEHPFERFAMVSIQRAELLHMLQALEDDWQDHCRHADPMADTTPVATKQVLGRINVLVSLLRETVEVLQTIEPEDDNEAAQLGRLVDHIQEAVAEVDHG